MVVAPDDKTVRIYFIGGTVEGRSGLLRRVIVAETATKVTIDLELGNDPSFPASGAGSASGQAYVTEVTLAQPLAGRTLTGRNNRGVTVHL